MSLNVILTAIRFLLTAGVYSSAGQAGASGYLAIMALLGTSELAMRPTAQLLNIVVAVIVIFKFNRSDRLGLAGRC